MLKIPRKHTFHCQSCLGKSFRAICPYCTTDLNHIEGLGIILNVTTRCYSVFKPMDGVLD